MKEGTCMLISKYSSNRKLLNVFNTTVIHVTECVLFLVPPYVLTTYHLWYVNCKFNSVFNFASSKDGFVFSYASYYFIGLLLNRLPVRDTQLTMRCQSPKYENGF